jgi:type VI secretion system secreted protein VgrG
MSSLEHIGDFRIAGITRALTPISITFESAQGLIGETWLRLDSIQATENVSQPFEVQLEMRADDFSEGQLLSVRDFLGRPATAEIALPESDGGAANMRYFNGIVTQFTLAEAGVYRATLKPALWRASLTNHYRLFQKKSIAETLKEVLDSHKVQYELQLGSVATSRIQDWLQAGETDLDFMQRLMDRGNIYYYFVHEHHRHIMVLANRPHYKTLIWHVSRKQQPMTLRYAHGSMSEVGAQDDDLLTEYQYQQNYTSSGVDFLLARSKAAWEPAEIDRARYSTASHTSGNVLDLPFQQYRVYQYGGGQQEASELGTESWDKLNTAAMNLNGKATSPLLCPGHVFTTMHDATLEKSPEYKFASTFYTAEDHKTRANLENRSFVVTQVQHTASATQPYSNSFQATAAEGLITPFNMQGTQQGTILAIVEATGGALPPTDWRYLEKTNFAFETYGFQDRETPEQFNGLGVYVRFITDDMRQSAKEPVWIKLSQTMQTVPEVGVVVTVGRSQDDSEVPEIQGTIEAHGSKVIMPHRWTANTNVGSSYSTNYGDSKGVRYGLMSKPDLKSAVNIVETAYATGRYKDSSFSQGASYSYSTSESGRSGILSRSQSFGNTESEFFADYTESYNDIGYSYSDSIMGSSDSYSTLTGKSFSVSVTGETETYSVIQKNSYNASIINGNSVSSSDLVGSSVNISRVGANKSYSTVLRDTQSYSAVVGKSYSESILGAAGTVGDIWSQTFSGANFHKKLGETLNAGLPWATGDLGLGSMSVSGNYVSESKQTINGNSKNTSTTIGDTETYATTIGNSRSDVTTTGNATSTSMTAGNQNSVSTFIGMKSDISMFIGGQNNIEMSIAMKNSLSMTLSLNNSLSMAVSLNNSISMSAALNNSINIAAALNNEINIHASIDNKMDIDLLKVGTKTTPLEVITEPANVKCRIGNIDLEIMTFKIFL